MLHIQTIEHMRKCAEANIQRCLEEDPGVQVRSWDGPDTLTLADELIESGHFRE